MNAIYWKYFCIALEIGKGVNTIESGSRIGTLDRIHFKSTDEILKTCEEILKF